MKNTVFIEATENTPKIILDQYNGKFEISGISRPTNVPVFFEPVLEWLERYTTMPNDETLIQINLISINTASLKILLLLLQKLKTVDNEENQVKVEWHYDENDDGLKETGILLSEMSGIDFMYKKF